jgi:cyclic-di-GMP-binding protein
MHPPQAASYAPVRGDTMPSFDIVIKADLQEVDNALNQARKEVVQRYDFRGSKSTIDWDKKGEIVLHSDDDFKLKALLDVVKERLVRRGVSVRNLEVSDAVPDAGGLVRQTLTLQMGVPKETAKEIVKLIKETKLNVQGAIQEDQVRVSGKKRDDLQKVIHIVKEKDLGYEFSFVNMRE